MADFKTEAEAKAFGDEFRSHLVSGVIEGPELAPDVAELEGLSGKWEEMDDLAIVDYMRGGTMITRKPDQWRPHHSSRHRDRSDEMNDGLLDIEL